ncbi:hypothetical protein CDL60_18155 [Roseateles noduli]|nr:hypothetical protein CDL60_18155 [Roseateles noduli]
MSEFQSQIEQAYKMAKAGDWDRVLVDWSTSPLLLNRCCRFSSPGSQWTFLHQAAYFGSEAPCRVLIRRGASLTALTHDGQTPAEVAEQMGHGDLGGLLRRASVGEDSLWAAPVDPEVLPSSNHWDDAARCLATTDLFVSYGGGLVKITKGSRYFVDAFDRVLIGWHGTFDPPCDMGGESNIFR